MASIADGPVGGGTGIPYMYLTPLDYTAKDLAVSIDSVISSVGTNTVWKVFRYKYRYCMEKVFTYIYEYIDIYILKKLSG